MAEKYEDISDNLKSLSEKTENLSYEIAESAADGADKSAEIVQRAIESMSDSVISETEKYLSEKERITQKHNEQDENQAELEYRRRLAKAKDAISAEQIKQERIIELEQNADKQYLAALEAAADEEERLRYDSFRNLKYALESGYITQDEYYNSLAALRDTYFDEDSSEWQKYSLEIINYQRSVLEEKKNQISEILSQTAEDIEKLQSKVQKNLSSYGNLFDTITTTYKNAGEFGQDYVITKTVLSDLKQQTDVITEYADAISAIKSKGDIPSSLLEELVAMDVEDGLSFANALLSASDDDFNEYIAAYRQKQDEISAVTAELTKEQTDALIQDMNSRLAEVFGEIPDGFWDCGNDSAQSFKDGFLDSLSDIFNEIQTQISQYASDIGVSVSSGAALSQTSYSASYNFYSSGQTVAQQLQSARAQSEIDALRGGY